MATTTTAKSSSANTHSPRFSSGDNLSSPKSHRTSASGAAKPASPPWTHIVRGSGGESEPVAVVSSTSTAVAVVGQEHIVVAASASDCSRVKLSSFSSSLDESVAAEGFENGNAGKKPVWNKPANGEIEVGSVMGADSWPALSECSKTSSKSYSDSPKALSDVPVSVSQGTEIAPTHKQATHNKKHNSSQNHAMPTRQKSMKRHGGNVLANGGLAQTPALPGPVVETSSNNNYSNTHKNSNWESGQRVGSGSNSHGGHDHPHPRNSVRRGNGGQYPRGDGSYNHNYGGRRDQDRNRDWNPQRGEGHMQPPGVPRGFIRPIIPPPPLPTAAPFIGPPSVGAFVSPISYPELQMYYLPGPPPESIRGVPFIAPIPPHAMLFHVPDPQLHTRILNQIDYYFSETNLIKDEFLRRHMDEQGWVPIRLIAGFKKIMEMTNNIQLIFAAIQTSTVVEVQGDKVRKRDDWWKFLIPSGPQSFAKYGQDMLADRVRTVTLEDRTNNISSTSVQADANAEAFLSRSSSGDSNNHFQPSSGVRVPQVNIQAGSDCSVSDKNIS